MTNDVVNSDSSCTYNAILAANGRYLFDCFISQFDSEYFIETNNEIIPELIKHLKRYKLRSKVSIQNKSDEYRIWSVLTAPNMVSSTLRAMNNGNRICSVDPRLDAMGIRVMVHRDEIPHFVSDQFVPIGEDFHDSLQTIYGIPSHGKELVSEKTIILESNFVHLNGVSFNKGCYVGQELIARTHHRGQIRKRLFGATICKTADTDNAVKHIRCSDDRETIFPTDSVTIESVEEDFTGRNVIDEKGQKIVGKVTSHGNGLNCCMVQLRYSAFEDIHSDRPSTVGLKIQDTDCSVIPHIPDYLGPFSKLFVAKE